MNLQELNNNVRTLLSNGWNILEFLKRFTTDDKTSDVDIVFINEDTSTTKNTYPSLSKLISIFDDLSQFIGPKGDKGDTGDTGPQGQPGIKGDKGDKGDIGDTGQQGPQGPLGATGPQGPQGVQGELGPRGLDGAKGDQGPAGPQGPQGIHGNDGQDGQDGPAGPAGPKGDQGLPGQDGSVGPEGPQGIEGPQGPQGEQGFEGPEGPEGPTGPQGVEGPRGYQGPIGPEGPQGPQGEPGETSYDAGTLASYDIDKFVLNNLVNIDGEPTFYNPTTHFEGVISLTSVIPNSGEDGKIFTWLSPENDNLNLSYYQAYDDNDNLDLIEDIINIDITNKEIKFFGTSAINIDYSDFKTAYEAEL
jgi:hypothetical protein